MNEIVPMGSRYLDTEPSVSGTAWEVLEGVVLLEETHPLGKEGLESF